MGTTRGRLLVGALAVAALAVLVLAVFGLAQLSSSEPQSRGYVAGSSAQPAFGYRPCGLESIGSLSVYAVQGDENKLIWSVRRKPPSGPAVLEVRLGEVPPGFDEIHALPVSHDWSRLLFEISTTSGREEGRAFDLSEIREGYVLWSGGYEPGNNLDSVPGSRFGC